MISQLTHLDDKIKNSDLIITGEGMFDQQTMEGKVVSKIIENNSNIPLIIL